MGDGKVRGRSAIAVPPEISFIGSHANAAYHASKGAVRIFTKATAVKYGPDGIRANSVHPGFMPPMRSSHPDPAAREEQVGLSTLHSAKGLEFDHVVVLGLNGGELMPHGESEDDAQLTNYRRLVAMAITDVALQNKLIVEYRAQASDGTLDEQ